MNEPQPPRRVAILWPSGHLDWCPGITNLASGMVRLGHDVVILTARNRHSNEPAPGDAKVRFQFLPGVGQDLKEPVVRITLKFLLWALPLCRREKPDFIIGAGIRGLVAAAVISRWTGIPAAYLCLELYPSSQLQSLRWKVFKKIERLANRQMAFSINQDSARARLQAEDNHIPLESIRLAPLSPPGPARIERSRHLAERFGLGEKNVILYAGALFAPFSVSEDLVRSAQTWPAEYVLVLHAAHRVPEERVNGLKKLDTANRVVFSTEPLPYAEVGPLFASADVGLVLYHPSDDNMRHINTSSGKLTEFLFRGVPVIASALPGLKEFVEENKIGMAIENVDELPSALASVLARREEFRNNAVACFDRHLSLDRALAGIVSAMEGSIRANHH